MMETAQPLPTPIPPVVPGGPFDKVEPPVKWKPNWKPNRMEAQAHTRDTVKSLRREKVYIGPSPKLEDPLKTLGHPARPRKHR